MKFIPDIWHLAGAQSLFTVRIYNTKSSQGTVALSAQAVLPIIRSSALVVDLLQLKMDHALLHLLFKL
jgi:hypothetical protein